MLRLIDRNASKPPKCYMDCEQPAVDWILEPLEPSDRDTFTAAFEVDGEHAEAKHKSLDCSIMDLSDDIAFGIHDLEDALALELVTRTDFERLVSADKCGAYLDWLKHRYREEGGNDVYGAFLGMLFGGASQRKHAVSRLVGFMVLHCVLETHEEFAAPLIRYRAGMHDGARVFLKALKKLVYEVVIQSPSVQHLEFKGQQMVISVFEALKSEPSSFLPHSTFELYDASGGIRVICDHVVGMTDAFLLRTYERLFSPRMGSVFHNV